MNNLQAELRTSLILHIHGAAESARLAESSGFEFRRAASAVHIPGSFPAAAGLSREASPKFPLL